jgi:hypothetical protein
LECTVWPEMIRKPQKKFQFKNIEENIKVEEKKEEMIENEKIIEKNQKDVLNEMKEKIKDEIIENEEYIDLDGEEKIEIKKTENPNIENLLKNLLFDNKYDDNEELTKVDKDLEEFESLMKKVNFLRNEGNNIDQNLRKEQAAEIALNLMNMLDDDFDEE